MIVPPASGGVYDHILFPTDGSDGAEAALDHAVDLAVTYDATLHVLYVVDTDTRGMATVGNEVAEQLETEGQSVVEATTDRVDDRGIAVVGQVIRGDPHEAILEYADANGIDLVVMATHGRRGLERYLLGSVTEKVVRSADVPVLTVRMEEDEGGA